MQKKFTRILNLVNTYTFIRIRIQKQLKNTPHNVRKIITHDDGKIFGFECRHCSHSGLIKKHEVTKNKKTKMTIIKY